MKGIRTRRPARGKARGALLWGLLAFAAFQAALTWALERGRPEEADELEADNMALGEAWH